MVLNAQAVVPTPAAPETLPAKDPETKKFSNPPRPSYPEELLTHTFKPYGCYPVSEKISQESMDVDFPAVTEKDKKMSQKAKETREDVEEEGKKKEKKGKKRKTAPEETVEEVSVVPKKKSKKTKAS